MRLKPSWRLRPERGRLQVKCVRGTRALLGLALLAVAAGAAAHDTWFQRLPATPAGHAQFALTTGTQFPVHEFPIGIEQLVVSGCHADGSATAPMAHVEDRDRSLVLRSAAPVPAAAALTCWAQLDPVQIDLDAPIVEIYLDEIRAAPWVRQAWAGQQARGVRWHESYTKNARVEIGGRSAAATTPVGMGLDALLSARRRPIRSGDALEFQILRDGAPLPGLAVELRHETAADGLWRVTDAQGRVRAEIPLAGRWLLRGTELRRADGHPERWVSRFVTLAFDVVQNAGSATPNARSANQAAASVATSSEPPSITTRR